MIVPLVVALALLSPAAPKKSANTWVALVHATGDVAGWREALQKAASDESGGRTWLPPPAVTLEEAQLALGCGELNDTCLGQIASMTNAASALVVDAKSDGAGASITVYAVKGGGGLVGERQVLRLDGRDAEDRETAVQLVRAFLKSPDKKQAVLVVTTDQDPGADVIVDGKKIGQTPFRGLVEARETAVHVAMEGKAPTLDRKVALKPGVIHTETFALNANNPATVATAPVVGEVHEVAVGTGEAPHHRHGRHARRRRRGLVPRRDRRRRHGGLGAGRRPGPGTCSSTGRPARIPRAACPAPSTSSPSGPTPARSATNS